MGGKHSEITFTRGFEFDFTPAGGGTAALGDAKAQLQAAQVMLETTLAAVLEACPEAIDDAFANTCAGLVLKARRRAREALTTHG